MAVRELDGVDDEIEFSTGNASTLTYGTYALLVARQSTGSTHTIIAPHTTAGTGAGLRTEWTEFNDITLRDSGGALSTIGGHGTASTWRLLVWRKATGSATPRLSVYNYDTASWTHANGNASIGDGTSPTASGSIRLGTGQFGGRGHFRIAAAAAWSNEVHWTADAAGDAAIAAAGLETAYQSWIDEAPSAAWKFDQAATTTAIVDDTGGGADESSLTGTTVVTGDDPSGFSFALSSGTDVTPADASHAHIAEQPALTQVHVLTPNDSTHAHTAGSPSLTQTHALTSDDALHAHTATQPTLSSSGDVAPDDALHGHTATQPGVTQVHVITAGDATHAHAADQVTVAEVADVLTNLTLTALAPVFAHGAATAEMLTRTAAAPELGHGTTEHKLGHGSAGEPTT